MFEVRKRTRLGDRWTNWEVVGEADTPFKAHGILVGIEKDASSQGSKFMWRVGLLMQLTGVNGLEEYKVERKEDSTLVTSGFTF